MNQQEIVVLLFEASEQDCRPERRQEISKRFEKAAIDARCESDVLNRAQCEGVRIVMKEIFEQTCKNRPERLPDLAPAFILMCAYDQPMKPMPEIDWNLLEPVIVP